jgi:hypothetical protein
LLEFKHQTQSVRSCLQQVLRCSMIRESCQESSYSEAFTVKNEGNVLSDRIPLRFRIHPNLPATQNGSTRLTIHLLHFLMYNHCFYLHFFYHIAYLLSTQLLELFSCSVRPTANRISPPEVPFLASHFISDTIKSQNGRTFRLEEGSRDQGRRCENK